MKISRNRLLFSRLHEKLGLFWDGLVFWHNFAEITPKELEQGAARV
jgi:hypothetical protein